MHVSNCSKPKCAVSDCRAEGVKKVHVTSNRTEHVHGFDALEVSVVSKPSNFLIF